MPGGDKKLVNDGDDVSMRGGHPSLFPLPRSVLRLADAGFQLVTSLKMETGCLQSKLERHSVLVETDNELNVVFQYE